MKPKMMMPGLDDLANLANLEEDDILRELKHRYKSDRVYTNVGDILLAVNPYKTLDIYGKETAEKYRDGFRKKLTPHVFKIGSLAYHLASGSIGVKGSDQCCVISGESGSGKTETCKYLIQEIIHLSGSNSELDQQILQVNPLLEAFGNAKTLMNNNSSRFGKYIQLKCEAGKIVGAKISEYLLEKSRIVQQNRQEQSFHVFYYLFAGLDKREQEELNLNRTKEYRYLTGGISPTQKHFYHFQKAFDVVVSAMDIVGFTQAEQNNIFKVLAGILNLGNVHFGLDEDDCIYITNKVALGYAAEHLGIDPLKLSEVLTRFVTVARGSHIQRRYTREQAQDVRDAVAKSVYGRVFGWIVNRINRLLAPPLALSTDEVTEIGILDIFGFEQFEVNSFEQLCINMANEQLQLYFNDHIFKWELLEYEREGVDASDISYTDNKPILDFFFGKPVGLLSIIDEECRFPKSSDDSLTLKISQTFNNLPFLKVSKNLRSLTFSVQHYAGMVEYSAKHFLDKNKDSVPPGMVEIMQKSDNDLVQSIFSATISKSGTLCMQGRFTVKEIGGQRTTKRMTKKKRNFVANKRTPTLGSQFKNSLDVLFLRLSAATPHFIRCLKPNHHKVADNFDEAYIRCQLKYTGILETTRIRKEGYSVRLPFADFVARYKLLGRDLSLPGTASSCRCILTMAKLNNWKLGNNKVFLKYWHVELLTKKMAEVQQSIVNIQKVVRGFLSRRRCQILIRQARKEQEMVKQFLNVLNLNEEKIMTRQMSLDSYIPPNRLSSTEMFAGLDDNVSQCSLDLSTRISVTTESDEEEFPPIPSDLEDDDESPDEDGLEDDVFAPEPKYNTKAFGRVGTKKAAIKWFQKTQLPVGAVNSNHGIPDVWFHGFISRRQSENLLYNKAVGSFLIRVSETRFGYSLSFRVKDRCKHYMIEQTRSGKYTIVGLPRVFPSLHSLIEFHQKVPVGDGTDLLTYPCGQEFEDQADYFELYGDIKDLKVGASRALVIEDLPPPLPEKSYKKFR